MKSIALYGYGVYGRRVSESFLKYWGGEYAVTAIFDRSLSGTRDDYWGLTVLHPDKIREEYDKGTFDAVMICIIVKETRIPVRKMLSDLEIPVFFPGKPEDFAGSEFFQQDDDPEITVDRDEYNFHVYKNMYGAVADHRQLEMLFFFNEDGKLSIDNYKKYMDWYEPYLLSYPFRLKEPIPEKVYMNGSYCSITKTYPKNYWHFTFETADCVYLMEKAGYRGKYIYDEKPFSRELLQIMGISPERLIRTEDLDIHKVYVFERLYDINPAGMPKMQGSQKVLPEMAASIRKKLKKTEGSPRKILLKRIGVRKMLNGEDIALKNGFTIIIPDNYSLLEQMNLFYNADIVMGPHGANCTNYLYMRKGTVFVEFFSDRWYIPEINEDVCEANGVHYLHMTGKACVPGPDDDMFGDFTVDEEALQRIIQDAEMIFREGRIKQNVPAACSGGVKTGA